MLEFAREQYLWLFALVALFFVVFFFARRWKKARVTYGFIWERVAKRTRPPTWKRLLRLILTLFVSAAMLSSAALYASGLGPAKEQAPAPLLIFIVIDNSPSMRAVPAPAEHPTRREAAQSRVHHWLAALSDHDRALLIHFERGSPVAGRWMQRDHPLGETPFWAPSTDFAKPSMSALAQLIQGVGSPPDLPALPKPQPLLVWLGDDPPDFARGTPPARLAQLASLERWRSFGNIPALAETFGSKVQNEAVVEAAFKPAPPGAEVLGWLSAKLRSGAWANINVIFHDRSPTQPVVGTASEYPIRLSNEHISYSINTRTTSGTDAFPDDDAITAEFGQRGLRSVILCHPSGEGSNDQLASGLKLLLPGREIEEVPADGRKLEADIVVLDRVNVEVKARVLLCFGALPPSLGEVLPVREAKAGLFDALEKPEWLGFEIPNLQLLAGREAFPLKPGHKLTALATHVEAGVLVAASGGERDVLYIGYSPTQSNFLFVPEGPTLLQRWLNAVQGRERMIVPPFCRMDQSVEIKLDSPATLRVKLLKGWRDVIGATEYEVTPSPDGRAKLGPFEQPGEYSVTANGRELGRMAVYWVDEAEQALPYTPLEPLDLTKLAPVHAASWVDWFPEILLWIALCGLLLEYLFWLAGWTD